MNKKFILFFCFFILLISIFAIAVNADTYDYYFEFSISNNTTTDYTNIPIFIGISGNSMIDAGYLNASGNETTLKEGSTDNSYLVTDNNTIVVIPTIVAGQTRTYRFYTGYSPAVQQSIIPGYGGYFTVADHADLELSDNFTITCNNTFVKTSVSDNICSKLGALLLGSDGSGNVTGKIINSPTTVTCSGESGGLALFNGSNTRWAQKLTVPVSIVTDGGAYLKKVGSPTGTVNFTLRKASDDSILHTFGTLDAAELTTSYVLYHYASNYYNDTSQTCYLSVEYAGGDKSNYVVSKYDAATGIVGNRAYYDGSWHDLTNDMCIYLIYSEIGCGVSSAVATGEHDIILVADGSNLTLTVDGVDVDTTTLDGASVPDNANNYIFGSTSVPYIGSLSITTGGTLRATYSPTSMIVSSNIPNNTASGSYNGTITWGTNPDNFIITQLGVKSYSTTTKVGSSVGTTVTVIGAPSTPANWIADGTFQGVLTPELKETIASAASGIEMPERNFYLMIMFGIAIAIGLSVLLYTGSVLITIFVVFAILVAGSSAHIIDYGLVLITAILMFGTYYLVKQH